MKDKNKSVSKLATGLACCVYRTRTKNKCKHCPYFKKDEDCIGNLVFDALSYVIASEYGKEMVKGLADIKEIQIGSRPEIPDSLMEDIRAGRGLKPIGNPLLDVKISRPTLKTDMGWGEK